MSGKGKRGTVLVVGGGIIGLEMATVYDALGVKVTVVELTRQLIPGCDPDLVRPLEKRIRAIEPNWNGKFLINAEFDVLDSGEPDAENQVALHEAAGADFPISAFSQMGMLVGKEDLGFGKRSWRYSMLVRDGVIEKTFIEPQEPGGIGVALQLVADEKAGPNRLHLDSTVADVAAARALRRTVKRYDAVFQFGTQQRSDHRFRLACELARNRRIGERAP